MTLHIYRKLIGRIFIVIVFLCVPSIMYGQDKIFQPILNYTSDVITNFSGGDKRSVQYMGLLDAGVKIGTDSACWWKGGMLNIELISTHGKGISATTLHDLQGICGIEAGDHPLLMWKLWYHQQFGKMGIRFGLQNINSDFMNQPFTDSFSDGSYNMFPTLALNYSLANYPVAGLGISLSYQFNKNWSAITSVFNGRVSDIDKRNRYNLKWKLNPQKDGALSITEVKYVSDSARFPAHMLGVGLVFHNKEFSSVKNNDKSYTNNYTFYAFGEHDFYQDANRTAGLFLQGSYATKDRNKAYGYSAVGLVMNVFFSRSHTDTAGVGLSQLYYQSAEENKVRNRLESTLEIFVKYQVNKYLTFKPTFYTIFSHPKPIVTATMIEFRITIF